MAAGTRRMGGALRTVLGLLLAAALLGLLLRGTDGGELMGAIRSADLGWLVAAQLGLLAGLLARVQRWTYVVRAVHPVPWRSLFSATQIGMLVNFTVPARLGEVVRAVVLSRLVRIPVARSLAMVSLDRVNDVIGLLAVLLVAALALARDATATFPSGAFGNDESIVIAGAFVRAAGLSLAAGVLAASGLLVLLYGRREGVLRLVRATVGRVSAVLSERVARLLDGFAEGLRIFRSGPDLTRAILWSLLSWGADVLSVAAVLAAFDVAFSWHAPFVVLSCVAVAILVPLTPGIVGQFHVPAVVGLLLAVPELPPARAKAVAIVDHLSTLVPIAVLGIYSLVRERIQLVDVVRRSSGMGGLTIAVAACLALATPGIAHEWVVVGAAGNPPDDEVACQGGSTTLYCRANIGAVDYEFAISRYETTNQEYVEFLNAVADADPHFLFNPAMQNALDPPGEIVRTGSSGSYIYSVVPGFEEHPIRFIDYFRVLRYANWLHNGNPTGPQGSPTTEDGAYTLQNVNPPDVLRNPGALFWLPSEDEWYKAAFFDPTAGGYWDYATGTDEPPVGEPPPGGPNSANFCPLPWTQGGPADCVPGESMGPGEPIEVGSYADAVGPWGTFDQAGNVWEIVEDPVPTAPFPAAVVRGSGWTRGPIDSAAFSRGATPMQCQGCNFGFRVATLVPEPAQAALRIAALVAVAFCSRTLKHRPPGRRVVERARRPARSERA